jgi:hypothetical protein
MDRQRRIAGLPAVRLRTAATPQSYAFDEYYVLHQGQLIRILLLHSGGREDWDFYNQFLDSFALESPRPPIAEGSVAGWTGTVHRNPVGSQVADYFRRDDGEIFGIHAYDDDSLNVALEEAAWTGAEIQVWGTLVTGITDAENRQIQVTALEILTGSSSEIRNLSPFAAAAASSALPSDRLGTYHAWSVVEGVPTQPWAEGAEGPGIGQWIQLDFPGELELNRLIIHNGYGYSDEIYRANNRVKRATLLFSNGESVTIDLADTPEPQEIVLARAPGPNIETFFVRLIIEEVYPGTRYDDTCLGEVAVFGRVLGDMPSH